MPRFHFHVHDGHDMPDPEGTELPGLEAARGHALRFASELLAEAGEPFWTGEPWTMEVTDERGLILFRLEFAAHDAPSIDIRRD